MADEATPEQRAHLNELRVVMDLERLGELIAAVATRFAQIREIDPPDYDGEEMRELAISGWRHVEFMADRVEFQASVARDLEQLTAPVPQHRAEFDL